MSECPKKPLKEIHNLVDAENVNHDRKRVAYVYNDDFIKICNKLPKVENRASMVHGLLHACGLLAKMRLISPKPSSVENLTLFHSADYVEFLQKMDDAVEEEKDCEDAELYGLTYDCPVFPGVFEYSSYVVGASVKAAQCLLMGVSDIAINWAGGWHHSKRDEASGFCYLNDIVIAILMLRKKFERVLYVDIDLHHGDGVEEAFYATSKVMTVSFHKHSPGFFPGSGKITDVGIGKGKYYAVNVPLQDGLQDAQLCEIFDRVMGLVREVFEPQAVVCQCGADGLTADPMDSFNLTPSGIIHCVNTLRSWKCPLLLLGGGGYNLANTARCWTQITAAILGEDLPSEIPEHKYFTQYGPDYQFEITPGNRMNKNSPQSVENTLSEIFDNLKNVTVN